MVGGKKQTEDAGQEISGTPWKQTGLVLLEGEKNEDIFFLGHGNNKYFQKFQRLKRECTIHHVFFPLEYKLPSSADDIQQV